MEELDGLLEHMPVPDSRMARTEVGLLLLRLVDGIAALYTYHGMMAVPSSGIFGDGGQSCKSLEATCSSLRLLDPCKEGTS